MSVRYIGSKARLVESIMATVGRPTASGFFVDAFCGTGAVAEAAARAGWASIRLNDHLPSAVAMAHARLLSAEAAPFRELGGYGRALARLNAAHPFEGFIWREYSPAAERHCGIARMYFTESNAMRIDAVRRRIRLWRKDQLISLVEERLLIADLLLATNRVANIAGTYGCFLSHWSAQSRLHLELRPRELFPRALRIEASVGDVTAAAVSPEDLLYLDPPYTKRQYAAYYHLLETITAGDEPVVSGVTGLRPWQEKASDFCYRVRALKALASLVEHHAARRIVLSYSDEGHVDLKPLSEALGAFGELKVIPVKGIGRYRPNQTASDARSAVTEYLLVLSRAPAPASRRAATA